MVEDEGERLAQREQLTEQRGLLTLTEHGASAGSAEAPSCGSAGHQPGRWEGTSEAGGRAAVVTGSNGGPHGQAYLVTVLALALDARHLARAGG